MHRATQCLQFPCWGAEVEPNPASHPQHSHNSAGGIHGRHWSQRPRSGHLHALLRVHLSLPLIPPWPLKAFLKPSLPHLPWTSSELLNFSGGIHSLLYLTPGHVCPIWTPQLQPAEPLSKPPMLRHQLLQKVPLMPHLPPPAIPLGWSRSLP